MKLTLLLEKSPQALGGLAFGIASLGWTWELILPCDGLVQNTAALVATLLSFLVVLKFIHQPKILWQSLSHPVASSVLPTIAMAWIVVSQAVLPFSIELAISIWSFALAIHLLIFSIFLFNRCRNFHLEDMLPAWFIPPIGLAVASLANPVDETVFIARYLLNFATFAYFVMLPPMIYRLTTKTPLIESNKPTLALFAAPPNLCLAGYLTFSIEPSIPFFCLLLTLAVLMTAFAYLSFIRLANKTFTPVIVAFTFPLVIGASAMWKTATFLETLPLDVTVSSHFFLLANVQLGIATAVTLFVSYRYFIYLKNELKG